MRARSLTPKTLMRLAGLVALAAASLSFAAPAQAAQVTCPGTFHVLHDDRIGALEIPAGDHSIIVIDDRLLSCAEASDLFRPFLQGYDGRLPKPWGADKAPRTL